MNKIFICSLFFAMIFIQSCTQQPQGKQVRHQPTQRESARVNKVNNDEPDTKAVPDATRTPNYPTQSYLANEQGVTSFMVYVTSKGKVTGSKLLESSGFERLDVEAIKYFENCLYKPATKNGKPVDSWLELRFRWKIVN